MLRREFLWGIVASGGACSLTGCGSIMYPERRHMPRSHQIDWKVAALDGLGLLLFFVPGVVAFVVDFYTGAIYLPAAPVPYPGVYPPPGAPVYPSHLPPPPGSPQPWPAPPPGSGPAGPAVSIPTTQQPATPPDASTPRFTHQVIPREELSLPRIEQVVTNHVGQPISLQESDARVSRLPRLDQYAEQCRQHRVSPKFGTAIKNFFDGLRQA